MRGHDGADAGVADLLAHEVLVAAGLGVAGSVGAHVGLLREEGERLGEAVGERNAGLGAGDDGDDVEGHFVDLLNEEGERD